MRKVQLLFLCIFFFLAIRAQVPESVFIYTDKSVYHAGDIVWLRADVVNGKSGVPLNFSKVVYVEMLSANNQPVLQCKLGMKDALGKGFLEVPQKMKSGKYILRAYTNWMKNFAPEYFFAKEITVVNINDSVRSVPQGKLLPARNNSLSTRNLAIQVNVDKTIYQAREKIILDISTSSAAKLSVSVYKIDSLQPLDTLGINSYFSRLPVQLPADKSRFSFSPEYYGHIVEGKMINKTSGKPAPGITGYLAVPGQRQFFKSAISDSSGSIYFDMKDFYGVNEVVLQTNINDTNYFIQLASPFSGEYASVETDSFDMSWYPMRDKIQHGLSSQIAQAFYSEKQNKYLFPPVDTLAFFGKPDARYSVNDYIKFTTLEDILREYVTEVGIKKRNGKLFPFVFDKLRRQPFSNAPLILVNAVPVFNVDRFMLMDPALVKAVEVVNGKYFRAESSFDGILSIITTNENVNDFALEKNAVISNYDGLLANKEFYSPAYDNEEKRSSRIPDFRNVLYWAPEVCTAKGNQKVNFYSSDLKGTYAVVVQGISPAGEFGFKTIRITVE